ISLSSPISAATSPTSPTSLSSPGSGATTPTSNSLMRLSLSSPPLNPTGATSINRKRNSTGNGKTNSISLTGDIENAPSKYPKPTHSYSYLITTAIQQSPNQQMTLNEIYEWAMETYPWYKTAINGWKV